MMLIFLGAGGRVHTMLVSSKDAEACSIISLHNPRLLKLGKYVASICKVDEYGGRILYACSPISTGKEHCEGDSGALDFLYDTCVLVDLSQWRDEMNMCVKSRFADVEIRVAQSNTSLSGFCVVMRMPVHANYKSSLHAAIIGGGNPSGKSQGEAAAAAQTSVPSLVRGAWNFLTKILWGTPVRTFMRSTGSFRGSKAHAWGVVVTGAILYSTYSAVHYIMQGQASMQQPSSATDETNQGLPFIHLTPLQSCSLHGWLNPKRTLHWDDVKDNPQLSVRKFLHNGLTPAQLKELQPDVQAWIDYKGLSFNDVEALSDWPLHPIHHLHGDLSSLATMHYPPRVLSKLDITFDFMRDVLNMDDNWMVVLRYNPKEWGEMGFRKHHAVEMGRNRVERVFDVNYDAVLLVLAAFQG